MKISAWQQKSLAVAALVMLAGLVPNAMAQNSPDKQPEPKPAVQGPRQAKDVKLQVGDPAPALQVEKWVKGEPVKGFEKGTVYVVEFWATWCGPCIKGIPHLTEVQKQYKDKGVRIVSVSIWEPSHPVEDGTYLDRVKSFVANQGDAMGYTVAFGGEEAPMAKTWMDAAGRNSIPSAFIVGKDGRVMWAGHPAEMDKPLEQIVAGKYDLKEAADAAAKDAEKSAKEKEQLTLNRTNMKKQRELGMKFQEAMNKGDKEEAMKLVDDMVAREPGAYGPIMGLKFRTLLIDLKDDKAAYEYARKLADGAAKDNAMVLNELAWTTLDTEGVPRRDLDLALTLATRADTLTEHKDAAILDTLARAQFEKGDVEKAIQTETKAISFADESIKGDLKAALERYKGAKK